MIQSKLLIPIASLTVDLHGKHLLDSDTLLARKIGEESFLGLTYDSKTGRIPSFTIEVHGFMEGVAAKRSFIVSSITKMSELRTAVGKEYNLKEEDFFLILCGSRLSLDGTVEDEYLMEGDILQLILHQRGCACGCGGKWISASGKEALGSRDPFDVSFPTWSS